VLLVVSMHVLPHLTVPFMHFFGFFFLFFRFLASDSDTLERLAMPRATSAPATRRLGSAPARFCTSWSKRLPSIINVLFLGYGRPTTRSPGSNIVCRGTPGGAHHPAQNPLAQSPPQHWRNDVHGEPAGWQQMPMPGRVQ
jgi:hypothetical protein